MKIDFFAMIVYMSWNQICTFIDDYLQNWDLQTIKTISELCFNDGEIILEGMPFKWRTRHLLKNLDDGKVKKELKPKEEKPKKQIKENGEKRTSKRVWELLIITIAWWKLYLIVYKLLNLKYSTKYHTFLNQISSIDDRNAIAFEKILSLQISKASNSEKVKNSDEEEKMVAKKELEVRNSKGMSESEMNKQRSASSTTRKKKNITLPCKICNKSFKFLDSNHLLRFIYIYIFLISKWVVIYSTKICFLRIVRVNFDFIKNKWKITFRRGTKYLAIHLLISDTYRTTWKNCSIWIGSDAVCANIRLRTGTTFSSTCWMSTTRARMESSMIRLWVWFSFIIIFGLLIFPCIFYISFYNFKIPFTFEIILNLLTRKLRW